MRAIIKAGLVQAMALGFAGLMVGVLAGWVSLALADGATAVAAISARIYPVLALVLSVLLVLMAAASLEDEDRVHYRTVLGASLLSLIAGLIGGLLATAFYMVVAINVPSILGGESHVDLRLALMAQISWMDILLVVGPTTICALLAGDWTRRRLSRK